MGFARGKKAPCPGSRIDINGLAQVIAFMGEGGPRLDPRCRRQRDSCTCHVYGWLVSSRCASAG
jgi:hypothetical protein